LLHSQASVVTISSSSSITITITIITITMHINSAAVDHRTEKGNDCHYSDFYLDHQNTTQLDSTQLIIADSQLVYIYTTTKSYLSETFATS
jgi:hypothetical protein